MQGMSHLKMARSLFVAILAAGSLLGCHDKPSHDGTTTRKKRSTDLPFVTASDGTRLSYFKYTNDALQLWGDSESELAVFVYPVFKVRSKGLVLPHMSAQEVEDLFGEELFGRQFSVAVNADVAIIDDIPVSRPLDLNPSSKWRMTYGKAAFDCRVTHKIGRDFTIRCDSNEIGLNLLFNMDRGFTSYQDYCGKTLCTYRLKSSVGILSPYHLRLLTEAPVIEN